MNRLLFAVSVALVVAGCAQSPPITAYCDQRNMVDGSPRAAIANSCVSNMVAGNPVVTTPVTTTIPPPGGLPGGIGFSPAETPLPMAGGMSGFGATIIMVEPPLTYAEIQGILGRIARGR